MNAKNAVIKIKNSIDELDNRSNMQNMGELEESWVENVHATAAQKCKSLVYISMKLKI